MVDKEVARIYNEIRETLGIAEDDMEFKRQVGAEMLRHALQNKQYEGFMMGLLPVLQMFAPRQGESSSPTPPPSPTTGSGTSAPQPLALMGTVGHVNPDGTHDVDLTHALLPSDDVDKLRKIQEMNDMMAAMKATATATSPSTTTFTVPAMTVSVEVPEAPKLPPPVPWGCTCNGGTLLPDNTRMHVVGCPLYPSSGASFPAAETSSPTPP